ncbi:ATP-binding cassette domain-containing protein [Paenibacillus sp. GCM10027626]|uniref:ABC transporter ATP-binding protein n=1 Tax=Paenibacillus sp. GCM10027626 TaxID=3273411 RepID=UPI00363245FD
MSDALQVQQLTKSYGNKKALEEVSFAAQQGSCFGLLGPNGAGKSTTMKILAGIISADGGSANIFGMSIQQQRSEILRKIGYVPQSITLYEKLSAYDNLVFFGEMNGVRGALLKQRIDEILERVGLAERRKDVVGTFSGGMKRRINIAASLLHKPAMIILDEPTVGIDPQSRNHIFGLIRELKKEGVTIVYSTHYMEEVEALCDDIAIIDHGKVIAQGELGSLLSRYGSNAVYVEAAGMDDLPQAPGMNKIAKEGRGWRIETDTVLETIQTVAQLCLERGMSVDQLQIVRPSLEQVFLALTGTKLRDE